MQKTKIQNVMKETKIIPIKNCNECPFNESITHTCDYYHKQLSIGKDGMHVSNTKSDYCKIIHIAVTYITEGA